MATQMLTLAGFLADRIGDDEDEVGDIHSFRCASARTPAGPCDCGTPTRMLAETQAKRRIVERYLHVSSGDETTELALHEQGLWEALTYLALPYADHPEYDESWRP